MTRGINQVEEGAASITGRQTVVPHSVKSGRNKGSLRLMHVNIQSMRNKIIDLQLTIGDGNYDIVCLTEHFLKETEADALAIENYSLASCFARRKAAHGGCLILCKDGLRYISIESQCELCAIELIDSKLLIVCVYRTPLGDFDCFLERFNLLLTKIRPNVVRVVIAGDFNVHFFTNHRNF